MDCRANVFHSNYCGVRHDRGKAMSDSKFKTLCAFLISIFIQLCIITFLLASIASAQTLSWTPPTTNLDGTPLTDLDSYTIGASPQSRGYSVQGPGNTFIYDIPANLQNYPVDTLGINGLYAAIQACDGVGNCSAWSNEIVIPLTKLQKVDAMLKALEDYIRGDAN